jgi:cytochrome c5
MVKSITLLLCAMLAANLFAASHHPQEFLDSIRGSPQEGEKIVKQFCSSCHAVKPLIELGAPKIKQVKDWKPRIKQGLDKLLLHTEEGYGAMPARGGCFECSSLQLQKAIMAMLPESLQEIAK